MYKIKIHESTLRELMLIQSIYNCKTSSDISSLVEMQPNPSLFFKVFLELGHKNLVSFLSFDVNSIGILLSDQNDEYFNNEFPIFFRQEDGKSAID